MPWLNEFKLALLNEDLGAIDALLDNIELDDETKLTQAHALLLEAQSLLSAKRNQKGIEINKLRKAMSYVKA